MSAAFASASLISESCESRSRLLFSASARSRQYAVFCRVKPSDFKWVSPNSIMRAGRKGVVCFFSRANREAAEARDTCCSRIILTSVEKPGGRAQSGGGPRLLKTEARSLSRLERVFAARQRLVSVSTCGVKKLPPSYLPALARRVCQRQTDASQHSPMKGVAGHRSSIHESSRGNQSRHLNRCSEVLGPVPPSSCR